MAVDVLHSLQSGHGDVLGTDTDNLAMLHVRLMNCECPRVEKLVYQGPGICEGCYRDAGKSTKIFGILAVSVHWTSNEHAQEGDGGQLKQYEAVHCVSKSLQWRYGSPLVPRGKGVKYNALPTPLS